MKPFRHRIVPVAAVAAALTLALAGCSGVGPGTAAVIDGHSVAAGDLQEATAQFNEASGQEVLPGDVLSAVVQLPVLEQAAADAEATVSRGEVESVLADAGIAEPNPVLTDYYLALYYQQATGGPADPAAMEQVDIEISPRYGEWRPDQLAVTEEIPSWIEPPADDSNG